MKGGGVGVMLLHSGSRVCCLDPVQGAMTFPSSVLHWGIANAEVRGPLC